MAFFFFFQAEDGIRDGTVTGVQTCALPILSAWIGAKQKFPTWFGPPRSSSRMFQSVHPSVPELKSLIIDRPYASPRLHRPYPVESKLAGVPSVKRMCLSG